MATSMTPKPSQPGTAGMCTAKVDGQRATCPHPRVPSADSSLCARHILIAANDAAQIGAPFLASIIREEGR